MGVRTADLTTLVFWTPPWKWSVQNILCCSLPKCTSYVNDQSVKQVHHYPPGSAVVVVLVFVSVFEIVFASVFA